MFRKKNYFIACVMIIVIFSFGVYRRQRVQTTGWGDTLVEVSNVQLLELFESDSEGFFVYVGRPTCPVCMEFRPIMEQAIYGKEFTFLGFNTDDNRMDDYFEEAIDKLEVDSIPFLIKVKNGEVIDRYGYADSNSVEGIQEWILEVVED